MKTRHEWRLCPQEYVLNMTASLFMYAVIPTFSAWPYSGMLLEGKLVHAPNKAEAVVLTVPFTGQ